jgi:hypothetical protein
VRRLGTTSFDAFDAVVTGHAVAGGDSEDIAEAVVGIFLDTLVGGDLHWCYCGGYRRSR